MIHHGTTPNAASGEATRANASEANSDRPRTAGRHTGQGVEGAGRAHQGRRDRRDRGSRGLGSLHDNLRTRGTRGTDGVRTWLGHRQVGLGQRGATLQHPHGIGEPVDRPGSGQVLATADPVLEQIGSPDGNDDKEDKTAGLHEHDVRAV